MQTIAKSLQTRGTYAGPLYSQLTAKLRERIRNDDWRAGMLIPSEADLAREYGVSVGTARKALEGLESDGWIVRKQGRGTFVTDLASQQMERLCRLRSGDGRASFDGCIVRVLEAELGDATVDDMRQLKIGGPGELSHSVVRVKRHYFRDGDCSVLEELTVPADLFPGLIDIKRTPLNLFSIFIDDYNIIPQRAKESVTAIAADAATAAMLDLEPGVPLLCSSAVIWDVDNRRVATVVRKAHARGFRYDVDLS
ncbi:MAG: GntR family transcriptional regulator [Pseudomonadota bacterium]